MTCTDRARRSCGRHSLRRLWALLVLASVGGVGPGSIVAGCQRRADVGQAIWRVPHTALTLPQVPGWVQDKAVLPPAPRAGGLALRLVQASKVAGSPRIDVILEAAGASGTVLEDYLTHNLRDMGALESQGELRILHVDQQRIDVGGTPAYRVHHEFTMGHGSAQVSLYQVSTFLVYEGRGITVSAAGRTELFHPLAASIAEVLGGMRLDARHAHSEGSEGSPIDLGRVGGAPG
jgi:hypothetical protein